MDCGIPFCHSGILISGMASGCPINNLIPEWNELIYKDLWREAYNRLIKKITFQNLQVEFVLLHAKVLAH